MVWVCGNVCKNLPQFWSKRREMHKKGREKPEEGSKLFYFRSVGLQFVKVVLDSNYSKSKKWYEKNK